MKHGAEMKIEETVTNYHNVETTMIEAFKALRDEVLTSPEKVALVQASKAIAK